jgi:hypothetical protein
LSTLHRQEPQFVRRNTFVQACLGLVSFSARYEKLLSQASAKQAAPRDESSPPGTPEGDELILLALLGGVALSRRLRAALEAAAPERIAQVTRIFRAHAARPRDLSR